MPLTRVFCRLPKACVKSSLLFSPNLTHICSCGGIHPLHHSFYNSKLLNIPHATENKLYGVSLSYYKMEVKIKVVQKLFIFIFDFHTPKYHFSDLKISLESFKWSFVNAKMNMEIRFQSVFYIVTIAQNYKVWLHL